MEQRGEVFCSGPFYLLAIAKAWRMNRVTHPWHSTGWRARTLLPSEWVTKYMLHGSAFEFLCWSAVANAGKSRRISDTGSRDEKASADDTDLCQEALINTPTSLFRRLKSLSLSKVQKSHNREEDGKK